MYARVSFYELGGASPDDAVRAFEGARNAIEAMEGNQGGMLLIDREGDSAITITLWETDDALRATAEQANAVREQATRGAGMAVRDVKHYEVGLQFGQ